MSFEQAIKKHVDSDEIPSTNLKQLNKLNITDSIQKFTKDFKYRFFKIIYNARLIPHLQNNFNIQQDKIKKRQLDEEIVTEGSKRLKYTLQPRQSFHSKMTNKRMSDFYIFSDEPNPAVKPQKPFILKEVIKFDGLRKVLKQDPLYVIYMEAVERWDNGYYQELLADLLKQITSRQIDSH